MQENAPDRYVVVKGDTLWDISGKFLKDPWKWPQIWNMNKDEIKNPHWIYPGDVIVLDMVNGNPRLRLLGNEKNDGRRSKMKLDPRIRITQFDPQAAPAIPASAIEPYLAKPLIIDEQAFKLAPRIALGPDDHVTMSTGDKAYATGITGNSGDQWQIFHGGKELRDPDTKELLGYEVQYVGDAIVKQVADVSTLQVSRVVQEVAIGDRLIQRPRREYANYIPHVPDADVSGKVISIYGGVNDAGPYTTVAINKGERDGLHPGHVLLSYKAPRQIRVETSADKGKMTLPEKSGNVYIYRVFPKLSYGLLLDSTVPINLLDIVRKP
ncbi:LysM peptidoglycan-binding domain-containing protein [Chitinimonas arctica]|nr:LysM peptidoglycan-binding domain-containing protein [Chitinimonas arctica]